MFFHAMAQSLLAHVPGNGVPVHAHFHLWEVAIIIGGLLCLMLMLAVHILDQRKAIRERDTRITTLREEVDRYRATADSLRNGLAQFAREDGIVAEELVALDPRLSGASELIARRGRQLEAALDIVTMVQAKQRAEAERLSETARTEEQAIAANRENAAALEKAGAELEKSARTVSAAATRLTTVDDEQVDIDKLN